MKLNLKVLSLIIILYSFIGCQEKKSKSVVQEVKSKPKTIEVLVGTYTNETSKGIYKLLFNPQNGTLGKMSLVAEVVSPSYLTVSKDKKFVYAVNENDPGKVSSFQWDENRTKLNLINTASDNGKGPCYVDINGAENLLAIANYGSGNISVFTIENGKIIDNTVQSRQHEVNNSVEPNRKGPHAHFVEFGDKGKFLYAVDLGIDQVVSYAINKDGVLGEKQTALNLDKGDGPRHLTFHPTKDIVFIINELSNTIVSAKVNRKTGIFEKIDKLSTLPSGYSEVSYCADIHISSDGNFLYGSNRGHNSIVIFSVSEEGKLKLVQSEPVQGEWPRNFTLSPDENFLLVANQKSNNITVFRRDQNTGLLTYTGNQVNISMPVCLKF